MEMKALKCNIEIEKRGFTRHGQRRSEAGGHGQEREQRCRENSSKIKKRERKNKERAGESRVEKIAGLLLASITYFIIIN